MEHTDVLRVTPVEHPDARVRRVGFDLTDPYVEQCWSAMVGPSATMVLRRLPVLWTERVPATITQQELARSIGLGSGVGPSSRLNHALDRLVKFRLAAWDEPGRDLAVYRQVPPLRARQVDRLPDWSRRTHEALLDGHLRQLTPVVEADPKVTAITERLDRLQHPRGLPPPAMAEPRQAVGR